VQRRGLWKVNLEGKLGFRTDMNTYYKVETFLLPTDAHNVKKHRVIKTF